MDNATRSNRGRIYSPAKTVADCFKYRNKSDLRGDQALPMAASQGHLETVMYLLSGRPQPAMVDR